MLYTEYRYTSKSASLVGQRPALWWQETVHGQGRNPWTNLRLLEWGKQFWLSFFFLYKHMNAIHSVHPTMRTGMNKLPVQDWDWTNDLCNKFLVKFLNEQHSRMGFNDEGTNSTFMSIKLRIKTIGIKILKMVWIQNSSDQLSKPTDLQTPFFMFTTKQKIVSVWTKTSIPKQKMLFWFISISSPPRNMKTVRICYNKPFSMIWQKIFQTTCQYVTITDRSPIHSCPDILFSSEHQP